MCRERERDNIGKAAEIIESAAASVICQVTSLVALETWGKLSAFWLGWSGGESGAMHIKCPEQGLV